MTARSLLDGVSFEAEVGLFPLAREPERGQEQSRIDRCPACAREHYTALRPTLTFQIDVETHAHGSSEPERHAAGFCSRIEMLQGLDANAGSAKCVSARRNKASRRNGFFGSCGRRSRDTGWRVRMRRWGSMP